MELFGVGPWELVAILLIMLVVAGPKRMIQWSYKLGQYVAVLRRMWTETAKMLQKELDEAGVDFRVPTEPPTRDTLRKEVGRALAPVTKPIQESLDGLEKDMKEVKTSTSFGSWSNLKPPAAQPPTVQPTKLTPQSGDEPPAAAEPSAQPSAPPPAQNGQGDFGTWSQLGGKEDSAS